MSSQELEKVSNLFEQLQLQKKRNRSILNNNDSLTIESVPCSTGTVCRISVNLTWTAAEQIAAIAAPMLSGILKSVEQRTQKEKVRDAKLAENKLKYEIKKKSFSMAIYTSIKDIHYKGLDYVDFCRNISKEMIKIQDKADIINIFDEPYRFYIKKKRLRKIYSRIRGWSIRKRFAKGDNAEKIAKHFNLSKKTVYQYK